MSVTQEDRVEAIAARLAWWWRMSEARNYNEPQCEMSWWITAAKFAVRAYEEEVPP